MASVTLIMTHKTNVLILQVISYLLLLPANAFALGNHPEASTCPKDKPYYAVCASSLHGLAGWTGQCYVTEKDAQAEATSHAKKEHKGEMRWVGVNKVR